VVAEVEAGALVARLVARVWVAAGGREKAVQERSPGKRLWDAGKDDGAREPEFQVRCGFEADLLAMNKWARREVMSLQLAEEELAAHRAH